MASSRWTALRSALRRFAGPLVFVPVVGVAIHDQIVAVKRDGKDWVLVDRGFAGRSPAWGRNDVVVVRSPSDRRRVLFTRLRHFEGEYVRVRTSTGFDKLLVVPRGHCWIEGDSPNADSRILGPLPNALIEGRVRARVWPPDRAGWLD
mmetsp:Transcript_12615/g.41362  ORF Transcript_12615/g.41362 Transcript_12615/m.41362 type:complete len:148 (-) Transcript_12615:109-552(-)